MIWTILFFLSAFLWIWAVYREDKRPEPIFYVAVAFVLGGLTIVPSLFIEGLALKCPFLAQYQKSVYPRAALFFTVVGPVEEILKFLPIWLLFYPRKFFNKPMDGIIYSAATAIGFATAENLYFLRNGAEPLEMLCRTPGGPFVHILFASYWGVTLGWATRLPEQRTRRRLIEAGLVWAAFMHGAFDMFTYSAGLELTVVHARMGMFFVIGVSFLELRWHMRRMQPSSQRVNEPTGQRVSEAQT